MTHTPGPWTAYPVVETGCTHLILAPGRGPIAKVYAAPDVAENAALIAAAPELLAALKAMVASYDGIRDALTCQVVIDKLARADAAIASAEGR